VGCIEDGALKGRRYGCNGERRDDVLTGTLIRGLGVGCIEDGALKGRRYGKRITAATRRMFASRVVTTFVLGRSGSSSRR
jgi:hypothetical protein